MKSTFENNTLTLFFGKRVDTSNAAAVEAECLALYKEHDGCSIVIDAEELEYISSVGLRTLMKLRKLAGELTVINVSSDVYEIFEMTGFSEILTVKKALRFVDTEGLDVIGQGGFGKIYRIDPETIVKVFHGFSTTEMIEKGIQNARTAFIHGIPTAIPFDIVRTADGLGVVYELLNAKSLADTMHGDTENFEKYAARFAELALLLSRTEFEPGTYVDAKDIYAHALDRFEKVLPAEDIAVYNQMVDAVPYRNTAVHGDFHARNMILHNDEILLIDMDEFGCGHPLWDCAATALAYPYIVKTGRPDSALQYTGLDCEEALRMWDCYLENYLKDLPDDLKKARTGIIMAYGAVRQCFIMALRIPEEMPAEHGIYVLMHKLLSSIPPQAVQNAKSILEAWK